MMPQPKDVWASGALYEPYVGRWSRLVAREFLKWLAIPAGKAWLDVGCGTGALTQTILDVVRPKSVLGVDLSPAFLEYAKGHVSDERASFEEASAESLPLDASSVDAAVSALVLNFVPNPRQAASEFARVIRPGSTAAAYVWDYADKMELIRYFWDAAVAIDPAARDLDSGLRFPICRPEPLAVLFASAGLHDVEARPIDVPTDFRDFDDYWSSFLGGQGTAGDYTMSLDEPRRNALRDRIRSKLPTEKDGSIHLIARAWAVRGRKPD
jgi:SAM-dependent methyltransferase